MTHVDAMRRRKQIAEAVRGGMTAPQATREFGVSANYVRAACSEHNVPCTFARGARHNVPFMVLARLLAGDSRVEAARSVGVCYERARQIEKLARKCGIKVPEREARN